jgi:hypothetical protein
LARQCNADSAGREKAGKEDPWDLLRQMIAAPKKMLPLRRIKLSKNWTGSWLLVCVRVNGHSNEPEVR